MADQRERADELLTGRVEGGGVAAAALEVGGQRIDRAHGDEVVLQAGGQAVRIRLAPAAVVGEALDGRWGELATHRLAALFADVAPGDHVRVRLTGASVATGDALALRVRRHDGSVHAVRAARGVDEQAAQAALMLAEAEADARGSETQRAAAAAAAREASRRITPRPPWGRCTRAFGVLAVGLAGLAVLTAPGWRGAMPQGTGAAASWVAAAGLGGAAMIMWSTRHDVPLVHRVGETRPVASRQLLMFMQVAASLLALWLASGRGKSGGFTPQPVAGLWIACVVPLLVALIGAVRAFGSARGLRPVARAARLAVPPPPHTWGVIEGVVAGDGGPVLTATITRTVQSVGGSGRSGWAWEELAVATTAAPVVHLEAGSWRADVHTPGMIWAAWPVWQPLGDGRAVRAVAAVQPGDRVRVLARTGGDGDPSLRAGGPESLFVIVGSPSLLLRRVLWAPIAIAGYAVLVVASSLV